MKDSTGTPPAAVSRATLTNLSAAKLRQKRTVQPSSLVHVSGTNLMWVTWNSSLLNDSVSFYNTYDDRLDYICKYKCEAGFYSPNEGRRCHYPSKETNTKGFPFEILVNKDNFEILEWKDDSSGSVPQNSVWTCPGEQIFVGNNKYGLGKVSTHNKAFYLSYKGKEYQYSSYQVLTISENVISQQIYNVQYNTDVSDILQFPPEVMHQVTISNYECHPVVQTKTLSKTYEVQQRWDFSFSIKFGTSTSIKTGLPFVAEGKIDLSTEVQFQFTTGTTVIESKTYSGSMSVTVPPNHSCEVSSILHNNKVAIPFTAFLRRTYGNGKIHTTSITGTYGTTQVGKIQAVVDRCELLEKARPCPIQSKSSMMTNDAMLFSLSIIFLFWI